MNNNSLSMWNSSFHPDSNEQDLAQMTEVFLNQRQSLALNSIKKCVEIVRDKQQATVPEELVALLAGQSQDSYAVFADPIFEIWHSFLHRAAANGSEDEVLFHCANLSSVLGQVIKRLNGGEKTYMAGSLIPVYQHDLYTYLMAVKPPSYDFQVAMAAQNGSGHPVELQAELLGLALNGIGSTWPELKEQITEFVKIIGYLPAANFRSCSASRYAGVVYLGNMDSSILDIEESLVHEAGHQVLYRLATLTPLTKLNTPLEANYELPWSGSKRDLFGFLHAFYIYALLAKYFWRRAAVNDRYSADSRERSVLILMGLCLAEPMLKSDSNLSEQGRLIVEVLCSDISKLKQLMLV